MLYNVREYHRPTEIDDAIRLLQRTDVHTVAVGGGVTVVGEGTPEIEAVVDLDGLGLNFIERVGTVIRLGATAHIQDVMDQLSDIASGVLADTARRMAGWNVRNAATIGGALASGDIHAPLSVMLAALDAQVTIYNGQDNQVIGWADFSRSVYNGVLRGKLITEVSFNAPSNIAAAYEQVARTPADRAIVSAAAIVRPLSGDQVDASLVVGGLLSNLLIARHTFSAASIDELPSLLWQNRDEKETVQSNYLGSAEYRESVAPILARRALHNVMHRIT